MNGLSSYLVYAESKRKISHISFNISHLSLFPAICSHPITNKKWKMIYGKSFFALSPLPLSLPPDEVNWNAC